MSLIDDVRDAWVVQGIAPGYHERMKTRLRQEWPVLADALDALAQGEEVDTPTDDEDTLHKVYWALGRAGLADVQITDAINQMQNAGILFRERTVQGEPEWDCSCKCSHLYHSECSETCVPQVQGEPSFRINPDAPIPYAGTGPDFAVQVQGEPSDAQREAIIDALLDELGWEWGEVPEEHIPSSREILGDMADRVLAVVAGFHRTVQGEPAMVHLAARRGGKTQAMIESMLAQANERGIRVEVVYPQGEPLDSILTGDRLTLIARDVHLFDGGGHQSLTGPGARRIADVILSQFDVKPKATDRTNRSEEGD